jgi:hypothetical protein
MSCTFAASSGVWRTTSVPAHAIAEALHEGTAQYGEASDQIGQWQRVKNAH